MPSSPSAVRRRLSVLPSVAGRFLPRSARRALSAVLAAGVAALALPGAASAQDDGLRVYISADMEGVTGTVTADQLGPGGFEYERYREVMTGEVLAVIEAAREAGAVEILVSDSHGNAQNLRMDLMPDDVEVIRGFPRPLGMMEGIDERFDAVVFVGYHASTTNPAGVRAHTLSSANLAAVRVNGIEMTEGSLNALVAGHFGVPVVLVTGDDVATAEVTGVVGDMEQAVVKQAHGFHSTRTLTPAAGRAVIRERAAAALARLGDFRPYRLDGPLTLEVTFKNYRPAEVAAFLPWADRVDAHTVRFRPADPVEMEHILNFLGDFSASITP